MATLSLSPSPFHANDRHLSSLATPPPPPSPSLRHPSSPFASPHPLRKHSFRNAPQNHFCHPAVLPGNRRIAAAVAENVWELYAVAEDALDQLPAVVADGDGGPIQLPKELDLFQIPEASPIQLVASVVLSGAIAVLLFRSLRRRLRRAKELKLRSLGIQSTRMPILDDTQKLFSETSKAPEVKIPPPSIRQTLFGALVAGAIAYILYNFTVKVESSFADKPLSTDYSIRNLTITIRTIINGICYLATFVFAANSIGLTLYSLQLLFSPSQNNDFDKSTNNLSNRNTTKLLDDTDSKSGEL